MDAIIWTERAFKLSDLKPYDKNPRRITKEQFEKLKQSIQQDGFHQRLLVTDDGRVIGGHQRIKALQDLGYKEIQALVSSRELTPEEFDRLNIRDNLQAGEWDFEALANHFDPDQLLDWGFPENLLPKQEGVVNEPQGDEDGAPEAPAIAKTVRGDLYEIGPHRLLCGDSTLIDDVDKLMGGAKADMVFTDPPYGVKYEARTGIRSGKVRENLTMIKNDDLEGEDLNSFLEDSIASLIAATKTAAPLYVCNNWHCAKPFLGAFEAHGLKMDAWIIWNKDWMSVGHGHYRSNNEFIFYSARGGTFYAPKGTEGDVWTIRKLSPDKKQHTTEKPVAVPEKAINNSSKGGDAVLDLFGGSGSTMVAAHKLGRTAYLMELDEKYCDVIVTRMRKLYPDLPLKRNGEPIEWVYE